MFNKTLFLLIHLSLIFNAYASEYTKKSLKSWQVYVQKSTDKDEIEILNKAYIQLEKDLSQVEQLIPAKHLRKLKKVKIWISFNTQAGAAYHPSEQWLRENGRNPKMAKGIEIQNAQNYLDWLKSQPMIILHELSHAYHHQVLGYNNKAILVAFNKAKKEGLYDSVEYIAGGKKRAYAMSNEKEYFAELTEAYFGKNDFFPFTKKELKTHDPIGYELINKSWK
jgi:hypothetical protein